MPDDITLTVNGKKYAGWETAKVTKSLESIAGTFELTVSDRWANGIQPMAWPFADGDECKITIGSDTVITGYIDDRNPEIDAESHTFAVSGRDKAGQLVDCDVWLPQWEFKNFDVYQFVKKLCATFSINVALDPPLIGKLPRADKLAISPGETYFAAIDQACRMVGVFPVSDGDGEITLSRGGFDRATTALIVGQNCKRVRGKFSAQNRFYRYVLLGQRQGSDQYFGPEAAHVKADCFDKDIKNQARVKIIRAEGNVTVAYAKARVQWEMAVRAARSDAVTVEVAGWRQQSGDLWPVNALVPVDFPEMRVKGDMLISQTEFSVSDKSGKITTLSLVRPDAFKPEPVMQSDGQWKELAPGV